MLRSGFYQAFGKRRTLYEQERPSYPLFFLESELAVLLSDEPPLSNADIANVLRGGEHKSHHEPARAAPQSLSGPGAKTRGIAEAINQLWPNGIPIGLIPILRAADSLGFPNHLQNDSTWQTEGVCHGTSYCGEVGLHEQGSSAACEAVEGRGQARRLLAIAAVLDGASREEAAKIGGMERQTLRDWVIRFNEQGPDGLSNKPSPGAPGKLTPSTKSFSLVSSTRGRSRRFMAWCAGGPATWSSNCTRSSASRYRMPRFTGRSRNWAFRM